jgi:hypothetical protein
VGVIETSGAGVNGRCRGVIGSVGVWTIESTCETGTAWVVLVSVSLGSSLVDESVYRGSEGPPSVVDHVGNGVKGGGKTGRGVAGRLESIAAAIESMARSVLASGWEQSREQWGIGERVSFVIVVEGILKRGFAKKL